MGADNRDISWADLGNLQHAELGLQAERESHWGIDTHAVAQGQQNDSEAPGFLRKSAASR